jgi:hypothetical protein
MLFSGLADVETDERSVAMIISGRRIFTAAFVVGLCLGCATTPDPWRQAKKGTSVAARESRGVTPLNLGNTIASRSPALLGEPVSRRASLGTSPVSGKGRSEAISLTQKYWRLTFFDDFRGKPPDAPADDYCYDKLKPQCHIFNTTFDCDAVGSAAGDPFPPTLTNLAAAVGSLDTSANWMLEPWADVQARYSELVTQNLKHLNKCTWTAYTMLNWMATDYQDPPRWTARFDPTQVKVDPTGKGHLELTARYAPLSYDCVYGGSLAGVNCQVYAFAANEVVGGVAYWVDPDPRWPGVYYAPINGACPSGGSLGVNCQVKSFQNGFLEETEVQYWVDTNPAFPGVYYAKSTPYRCKDNIPWVGGVAVTPFRNLTCPVLNGGLMSSHFANGDYTDQQTGQPRKRGFMQQEGRFEVKLRVPTGVGSFPAAWMLPNVGGWPYKGGEIDIMESRETAEWVGQTYHHGKCYDANTSQEDPSVDSPGTCRGLPGMHSLGLTRGINPSINPQPGLEALMERTSGEFWKRDHVYAVEWSAQSLDFYTNNVLTNSVVPGTGGVGWPSFSDDPTPPPALQFFSASNFPSSPLYWILNHSSYVPQADQPGFAVQTHRIDWVKTYASCTSDAELCPCGGQFTEGVGCSLSSASALQCPAGEPVPVLSGLVYQSPCAPVRHDCVQGGVVAGPNCQVYGFQNPQVIKGINYWVDADPRWPGVYYAPINGGCPFGGVQGVNCRLQTFQVPPLYVVQGVIYWVDPNPQWAGVYYAPIGGQCIYGGTQGVNCQLMSFSQGQLATTTQYWVDTNPSWPGIYYAQVGGNCLPGDTKSGSNCQYFAFTNPEVIKGVNYWVDADPLWPGVYYAQVGGQCPYGGLGQVNCRIASFKVPPEYIMQGVNYWVDTNPQYSGVYYARISGQCPYGGSFAGPNCQLLSFAPDFVETGVDYWVDTNPFWPGVYYAPDFR